jgi:hypothetical protein
MVLVALFVFTLFVVLLLLSNGLSSSAEPARSQITAGILVNSFLKLLLAGAWGFFLVFLMRGLGLSIVVYFAWGIVEGLLTSLPRFFDIGFSFERYLPRTSIEKALESSRIIPVNELILPGIYILLLLLVPYYLLIRRDIK